MNARFLFSSLLLIMCSSSAGGASEAPSASSDKELTMNTNVKKLYINAADFGAKGDGKTDDTSALQKAFDAACFIDGDPGRDLPRHVILPAGIYRLTRPLQLEVGHWNLIVEGTGSSAGRDKGYKGVPRANTTLLYDGPDGGDLMRAYGVTGLTLLKLHLDGNKKCGTLISMNSVDGENKDKTLRQKYGSRAAAEWVLKNICFMDSKHGFVCGDDSWSCASDITMEDLHFYNCEVGFLTISEQNLNYMFTRLTLSKCDIGLYVKKGGSVVANLTTGHACGTAIRIDGGGINGGTHLYNGIRVESRTYKGKRTSILKVKGEVNVVVNSLLTTCMGLDTPHKNSVEAGTRPKVEEPTIVVGNRAVVTVRGSMFSGPVADLTGQSWTAFENCRFRFLADPRRDIKADKDAGYEVRDSWFVEDELKSGEDGKSQYSQKKRYFVRSLRKEISLPELAE